jgi:hypothetical protein
MITWLASSLSLPSYKLKKKSLKLKIPFWGQEQDTLRPSNFFVWINENKFFQNIQCVHKVPSGVWKFVASKQIELATCSFRQITEKLWKFFLPPTDGITGHLYVSQSVVCEMGTVEQGGESGSGEGEACNRDILPLCTSYSSRTTTTVSTINHNRCRTKSEEVTMPRDILDQSQRSANLSLWPVIATARASNRLVQE